MIEQHPLAEAPIVLGLNFHVDQHQTVLSREAAHPDQRIRMSSAVLGLPHHRLELTFQQLIGMLPIDVLLRVRQEEPQKVSEVQRDGFFPGRVEVVIHDWTLAGRFLPKYYRMCSGRTGMDKERQPRTFRDAQPDLVTRCAGLYRPGRPVQSSLSRLHGDSTGRLGLLAGMG